MVELSISIEGLCGLTWPQWRRLVGTIEALGFAGLYLSDHFALPFEAADPPAVELIVALTYLADRTERVRFGPMVSPLSFRDPVLLTRQALALDEPSGGRLVLGVGVGWMEREHRMYGFDLGDVATRFARFEEGLAVISRLLHGDEPVSFDGRFFRLDGAQLPGPRRPGGPPLLIGGGGPKRTLPLVARFADSWNGQTMTLDQVRVRSARLDELLTAAGRSPADVRRTFTLPVLCYRTPAELERRVRWMRTVTQWRAQPASQLRDELRSWFAITGSPEEVAAQVRAYADAGISEVIVQWYAADDLEGLAVLAAEVMPRLAPSTH